MNTLVFCTEQAEMNETTSATEVRGIHKKPLKSQPAQPNLPLCLATLHLQNLCKPYTVIYGVNWHARH